ncbi:hypothetical protein TNCV_1088381 [Trichonephila clavipes]|uniref:Uncharacterized protein n=1 Tax=Trichonephila clavipes TaxID=2585209 RepID=A0A8X6VFV2_TRICX|nr:hypothetical protein TNCV_1088381 [Trichonephila clavipes]
MPAMVRYLNHWATAARTFSRKESLKQRVQMISENVLMMVDCNLSPKDNVKPQSMIRYCAQHHPMIPSIFHSRNQGVNMKIFLWLSPDEHTSGGLE